MKVKDPYDREYEKEKSKAYKKQDKAVKPVAKDTNKTRRKQTLRPLANKIQPKSFKRKATKEPKNIK